MTSGSLQPPKYDVLYHRARLGIVVTLDGVFTYLAGTARACPYGTGNNMCMTAQRQVADSVSANDVREEHKTGAVIAKLVVIVWA